MKKLFALLVGLTMVAVTAACTVTEGGSSLPVGSEASSEAGSSGVASSEVSSSEVNSSEASSDATSSETTSNSSEVEGKKKFYSLDEIGSYVASCINRKDFNALSETFLDYNTSTNKYEKFDYSALASLEGIEASYEVEDEGVESVILTLNVPEPKNTPLLKGENKIQLFFMQDQDTSFGLIYAVRVGISDDALEKAFGVNRFDAGVFDFLLNVTKLKPFASFDEIAAINVNLVVSLNVGTAEMGDVDILNGVVEQFFGVSDYYRVENGKIVAKNGEEYMDIGASGWHIGGIGASIFDYTVSGDTVTVRVIDTCDPLGIIIEGGYEYTVKLVMGGYNIVSGKQIDASEFLNLTVKSYFSTPKEMGDYIVRCFDEKRFDILAKAFSPSYDIYDYSVLSSLDGIELSYDVVDADDSFATVRLMLNVPNPNGTAMVAGMNKITLNLHNYGDGFYLYAATREPDEAVDLTAALGVSHKWDTIPFTEFLNHTKLKTFDSTAELTTNDIESAITYLIDNPDNLDKVNNAIYEYFGIENYCSMENGLIVDKNGMEFPGVGLTIVGINSSRGASYYSYTTSGKVVTIRILATLDPLGLFLDEFVDYTVELSENSYRIISAVSAPVTELLN